MNSLTRKENKNRNSDFIALGNRLRNLRLEKGHISLEKFANDCKISRSLYSNYEYGNGNITYKNLLKVTRALKISLKDFFSEGFKH